MKMSRAHANTDYGAPTARANKFHLHTIIANHILHLISSLTVMSIAAYFIANFNHNTHIVYWVSIAAVDSFIYLLAVVLPFLKSYKGYLAPIAYIFSYLWLTAFIFAAQDYEYDSCALRSPTFVNKCHMKRTLEAFAFIAFFTNVLGTLLETRLWDVQRFGNTHHNNTFDADKHDTTPAATAGGTATTITHPTASAV